MPNYADGITIILSDGVADVPYLFVKDDVTGITRVDYAPDYVPSRKNKWSWVTFDLEAMGSSSYSITVHFEDNFADDYRTHTPVYVMLVTLLITLVTSFVFVMYDYLRNRSADELAVVSATRREFVRYISHEIRTPMNTIHIGMSILLEEVNSLFATLMKDHVPSGEEATLDSEAMTLVGTLADWLSLITNMSESSKEAILVLNDIVNYDKIQMRTVHLDKEPLHMWNLLYRYVLRCTIRHTM